MTTLTKKSQIYGGIGLDFLWFCVILAGALFVTSIIPLVPNDFWWHLKIGEWIIQHRAIPTTNMYAWSLPSDTPFYYGTWLGELLLYGLHKLGGLELIIFTRTFLVGLTFWLVGNEARQRSGSWRISALVIAIGFLMIVSNLQVRTQIWSWLPFIIYLILLRRFSDRNLHKAWLILLPLLMIFWVNAHGAFILGLVLTGLFFIGELTRTLLKHPDALSKAEIYWLALINLLTALVILVNPRGAGIVQYVIDLMTDQPSQRLVVEWQSPTPQGINNITFFASILLLIVLLVYSRYRLTPTRLLTILAFLWLAWSGVRYIVWYALVIMPILAELISHLPIKFTAFQPQRNRLNLIIAIFLFIPVILVQPWVVEKFPLPATYKEQVLVNNPIGPLLSVDNPIAAVDYLKTHPGGKLFNEMGYGSYLIWALPDQGVFVDPRVELFPYELWQDYVHISSGTDYNRILDQYGVNRLLVDKDEQAGLIKALGIDPHWHLEYEDQFTQIWYVVSE